MQTISVFIDRILILAVKNLNASTVNGNYRDEWITKKSIIDLLKPRPGNDHSYEEVTSASLSAANFTITIGVQMGCTIWLKSDLY